MFRPDGGDLFYIHVFPNVCDHRFLHFRCPLSLPLRTPSPRAPCVFCRPHTGKIGGGGGFSPLAPAKRFNVKVMGAQGGPSYNSSCVNQGRVCYASAAIFLGTREFQAKLATIRSEVSGFTPFRCTLCVLSSLRNSVIRNF